MLVQAVCHAQRPGGNSSAPLLARKMALRRANRDFSLSVEFLAHPVGYREHPLYRVYLGYQKQYVS